MTDSYVEIESLMRGLDSVIEEFMESASHVKYESKIEKEHLRKVWHIDQETDERMLGVTSQRCAK